MKPTHRPRLLSHEEVEKRLFFMIAIKVQFVRKIALLESMKMVTNIGNHLIKALLGIQGLHMFGIPSLV